jgi:hypothetical protein
MARMALPVILGFVFVGAVSAQDAVPETPPELRDFRLDPQRPAPLPEPEVQPPPLVPTTKPEPDAPQGEPPSPAKPRSAARQSEPRAETVLSESIAAPAAEDSPEAKTEPPSDGVERPEAPAPIAEAPESADPASTVLWWPFAAALLAALAVLAAWLLWRRRRANGVAVAEISAVTQNTPPAPVKPTPPIIADIKRPRLTLEFVPDKATLGFSALTLKGQLHLANEGDAPASDMQLRATLISASQRQKETIAAFHGGAIPIDPNVLGNAQAGERLALQIEMAVQVAEIDSYIVGDKKIFVPVMLANVAYSWDGGADNVTIACMIGRESEPAGAKMGPLRLDLGPRSFAPLGQRPITA